MLDAWFSNVLSNLAAYLDEDGLEDVSIFNSCIENKKSYHILIEAE